MPPTPIFSFCKTPEYSDIMIPNTIEGDVFVRPKDKRAFRPKSRAGMPRTVPHPRHRCPHQLGQPSHGTWPAAHPTATEAGVLGAARLCRRGGVVRTHGSRGLLTATKAWL